MVACGAGICGWLTSSGESAADSPSTPFSVPGAGSGAFRQACKRLTLTERNWAFVKVEERTWMRFLPSGLVTKG